MGARDAKAPSRFFDLAIGWVRGGRALPAPRGGRGLPAIETFETDGLARDTGKAPVLVCGAA